MPYPYYVKTKFIWLINMYSACYYFYAYLLYFQLLIIFRLTSITTSENSNISPNHAGIIIVIIYIILWYTM